MAKPQQPLLVSKIKVVFHMMLILFLNPDMTACVDQFFSDLIDPAQ